MFGAIPKHNLCDLVYEGKSISDIITWGPMEVGFISGGSGIAGMSNLGKDALTCIIQNLAEPDALTDIIIVDTGAGISDSVLEFLVAGGEVLFGDHTGAYFHHGFLFSAEGTVQTSEIPGGFHEGDDGGQPGK